MDKDQFFALFVIVNWEKLGVRAFGEAQKAWNFYAAEMRKLEPPADK